MWVLTSRSTGGNWTRDANQFGSDFGDGVVSLEFEVEMGSDESGDLIDRVFVVA
jgi:hypothetical protein